MFFRARQWFAIGASLALLVGCSGGDDAADGGGGPDGSGDATSVDPAECGLDAFAEREKPVEVTFWHAMARANNEWLEQTVDEFNASQSDVHVTLVQQPGYQETLTKYRAGLSTGDLPDLVQLEETTVQVMIDSRSTVPMQACVDADGYDLADFLPRATAYYSSGAVLLAMPWTVSNPLLMYNPVVFQEAGLDPAKPPETLSEVREYSKQIVESGAADFGIALRIEPYVFEFLNAKSGGTYVNNGNGRDKRATGATLDTDVAREIWAWWKDMVDSGLALNTGADPGGIDHLVAVGTGDAAMVFEASGVLGTVEQVLRSGEYPGVEIGAAALPALERGGGIPVGDGALWMPESSPPERRGAVWQFVKFLSSPEQQASLSVAGGYAPIRESAVDESALAEKWREAPAFRVAYDQLLAGPLNEATVGSVIGDYQGVRDAVRDGLLAMLADDLTPEEALARAQEQADEAIQAYNDRVPG